jgi:hypothetical protein
MSSGGLHPWRRRGGWRAAAAVSRVGTIAPEPLVLDERLGLEFPYRFSRIVVGRPILIRRVRIDLSI